MTGATATAAATTIQFDDGFVKDDFAKMCEPFQKPHEFLWTGRPARVGQRTETQVDIGNHWCRLSGVVTEVGPIPAFEEWNPPDCGDSCGNPHCVKYSEMSVRQREEAYKRRLRGDGAAHGQRMVAFARLNFDFFGRPGLPFEGDRVYRVTHVVDDAKYYIWCVDKIEDVTNSETDLPKSFKDWDETFGHHSDCDGHHCVPPESGGNGETRVRVHYCDGRCGH